MDVIEAMKTNHTCRYYTRDDVSDEVLGRVLDAARWAPSGGNRQPLRLIAVRDAAKKRRLQALYLPFWEPYVKGVQEGAVRVGGRPSLITHADHFARHMAEVPVLVVVCARLADVHPTDTELDRLSIVGGASVYPAVQNMILAARNEGLGTALTTLLCAAEPEVKTLLEIPDDISTAAVVALGWPAKPFPVKLNRRPLGEMAYVDRYGEVFAGD